MIKMRNENQSAINELQVTILPTHELLGGFCTSLKSTQLKSMSQCLGYEYPVNSNGVFYFVSYVTKSRNSKSKV